MGAVPSAVQLSIDAGSQHGKSSTQLPMVSMRLHLDLHVASKSSVKLIAAQHAVERCFPKPVKVSVQGHNSPSNVRSQPVGDEETLLGARNRAAALRASLPAISPSHSPRVPGLLVAVEGGVGPQGGGMECFAWVVVQHVHTGAVSEVRSASFPLPPPLVALMRDEGLELGQADDKLFARIKSGQGSGTVGHLSSGIITRQTYYEHAVVMALLPFMQPAYYGPEYYLGVPTAQLVP